MIYNEIESPFADGIAVLQRKSNVVTFRKCEFEIQEHYYVCQETKEEFTNGELDRVNVNQAYNQYRDRFGLPFPDQIKRIRERYEISASKMSDVLGLGANTYRLYEQGEVPSIGYGRLIIAASDPDEFQKFLRMSEEVIGEKDFNKLKRKIEEIKEKESKEKVFNIALGLLFNKITPDLETGYRLPNLEKISHMIMYFSGNAQTFKTKLNKLLFYSDFLAFKNSGFGISGLDYRAISYGPVPSKFERLYEEIVDHGYLQKEYTDEYPGYQGTYFIPALTFNELLFEPFELEIMKIVAEKFKYLSSTEMKNLSHEEPAWLENIDKKKIINYNEYGFTLQAI